MILSKNTKITTSPAYLGYIILKRIRKSKEEKVMIYEIVEAIKSELGIVHYRQLLFALLFLHQSGIIDFAEPYIYKK